MTKQGMQQLDSFGNCRKSKKQKEDGATQERGSRQAITFAARQAPEKFAAHERPTRPSQ